jgi:serine protease inhibitor
MTNNGSSRVAHSWRGGLLVATVMLAVAVAGCNSSSSHPSASVSSIPTQTPATASPTPEPSDLLAGITVTAADETAAAQDGNALTLDVLQQFEKGQPNQNFVDSAYSLATALAMLELGANGETQTQIATVMHAAGVTPEQQAAAWKQFDASLLATAKTDGISLDVANAIWLQKGLPFDPNFLNTLSANFAAPSSQVDFNGDPSAAAALINHWVSDATDGMIPTVVSASDVQPCKLVLADAIYFDAHWLHQFQAAATAQLPFFRPDNSQVTANMMQGGPWTLPAYIGDGVTAVELPYVGGHFAADVIIPTSQTIGQYVASMTSATLEGIDQQLTPLDVNLTLPRFSISSSGSLMPMLKALGMIDVFAPDTSNLSGILPGQQLFVGLLEQRALIKVDEVGTTAAAATVVGGLGGAGAPPVTSIAIDHPFLFVIRDITSGAILFTAQVADPTAS